MSECECVCGGGILIDLYPMRQLQKEIWSDLFDTDKEGFPKNIVKIKLESKLTGQGSTCFSMLRSMAKVTTI